MIDFHNDEDLRVLEEISLHEDLPEFVKKADAELLTAQTELPKEAFAMPSTRRYPAYDQASTWLSSRYFAKSAGDIPEPTRTTVEKVLKEACDMFGIGWPEKDVVDVPEISKSAYALAGEYDGREVLRYAVDTRMNTEASIMKFAGEYKLFPPEWRRDIAVILKEKAAEHDVRIGIGDPVLKYATDDKCVDTITDAMNVRATLAGTKYASLYKGLAEKAAEESPDIIVGAIEGLDKAANIAKYWDVKIPDPVLSVYKAAATKDDCLGVEVEEVVIDGGVKKMAASGMINLAGRSVSLSRLSEMPLEWYDDILGSDIAAEISEGGEVHPEKLEMILSSLARPSQLLIVSNLP